MAEEIDEIRQLAIEIESHLLHFRRIGPDLVTENVVGRQADREQVGRGAATDVLVDDQFLGELEFVLVGRTR